MTEYYTELSEQWITDSEWSNTMNQWIPKIRQIQSFDPEGKIETLITASWNQEQEDWFFYKKAEYAYDAFDNLNLLTEYQWNTTSQAWDFPTLTKIDLTYDDYDRITGYISYNKEFGATEWTGGYQYDYFYDDNGNVIAYNSYRWRENQQQWEGINRLVHYFGSGEVRTKDLQTSSTKLLFFPNPANETIYFTSPIPLYCALQDLSGGIINFYYSHYQIDISHLSPGMYLLRVETTEGVATHKLVKL